eukprot:gene4144-6501_t
MAISLLPPKPKRNAAASKKQQDLVAQQEAEERRLEEETRKRKEDEIFLKEQQRQREKIMREHASDFTNQVIHLKNYFTKMEEDLINSEHKRKQQEEWNRLIECTSTPDLLNRRAVNAYISAWLDESLRVDINPAEHVHMNVCNRVRELVEAFKLAVTAHEKAMHEEALGRMENMVQYNSTSTALKEAALTKLNNLYVKLLQFADNNTREHEDDLYVCEEIPSANTETVYFRSKPELPSPPTFEEDHLVTAEKDKEQTEKEEEIPDAPSVTIPRNLAVAHVAISLSQLRCDPLAPSICFPPREPKIKKIEPPQSETDENQISRAMFEASPSTAAFDIPTIQLTEVLTRDELFDKIAPSVFIFKIHSCGRICPQMLVPEQPDDVIIPKPMKADNPSVKTADGSTDATNVSSTASSRRTSAQPSLESLVTRKDEHIIYHPFYAFMELDENYELPEPEEEPEDRVTSRKTTRPASTRSVRSGKQSRVMSAKQLSKAPSASGSNRISTIATPKPTEDQQSVSQSNSGNGSPSTPEPQEEDEEQYDDGTEKNPGFEETYIIVGDILRLHLLNLPIMPSKVAKWTIRQGAARVADPSSESEELVDPVAGMPTWPAIKVRAPVPIGILLDDNLRLCAHDVLENTWKTTDVLDFKLVGEPPKFLEFSTLRFTSFALYRPRDVFWELNDWSLVPFGCGISEAVPPPPMQSPEDQSAIQRRSTRRSARRRDATSAKKSKPASASHTLPGTQTPATPSHCTTLRLVGSQFIFYIEVSELGCRLASPQFRNCEHLSFWQRAPFFVEAMISAGIDIFPAMQSPFVFALRPTALERTVKSRNDIVFRASFPQAQNMSLIIPPVSLDDISALKILEEREQREREEVEASAVDDIGTATSHDTSSISPIPRVMAIGSNSNSVDAKRAEEESAIAALCEPSSFRDPFQTYLWSEKYVYPVQQCEGDAKIDINFLAVDRTIHATLIDAVSAGVVNSSATYIIENMPPRMFSDLDFLLRLIRPLSRNTGRDCRIFALKEKQRLLEIKYQAELELQQKLEEERQQAEAREEIRSSAVNSAKMMGRSRQTNRQSSPKQEGKR